jgi:hypothetical protein
MARSLMVLRRSAITAFVACLIAACGGGAATTAPGSTIQAGSTGNPPGSTAASTDGAGGTAAATTDFCKLFTEAEISTFLGRPAHLTGQSAASTTPFNCSWQDNDLTTVWVAKSDAATCASDKDAVGSQGGTYPGADFAGPSVVGAMFAGVVRSDACYEVEVSPTEKSPAADAVAQLLAQFVQRVGA